MKKWAHRIAALVVIFIWGLLAGFGVLQKFDLRVYDLLLGLRKDSESRPELLFVEIDNKSLEDLGAWPWSRDILAESLLRMKELGASTAVFDIEYLSPSKLGVNPESTVEIGKAIDRQKNDMADIIQQFADAAVSGAYSKGELRGFAKDAIEEYVYPSLDELKSDFNKSAYQDNDRLFAQSLQFFGNTWLTINILDLDIKYDEDYLDYVKERCLYKNVTDKNGNIRKNNLFYLSDQDGNNRLGFCPAKDIFIKSSRGAGFTNVVLDSDGTRRRVELLSDQGGVFAAQLVFAPVLKILNPEKIVRYKYFLRLINATDPDTGKKINITIPLDRHGRMLINWLNKEFIDSFRHESVIFLTQLNQTESAIVELLENFNGFILWDEEGRPLPYKDEVEQILSEYNDIKLYKAELLSRCLGYDSEGNAVEGGISEDDYAEYFGLRQEFFDRVSGLLDGSYFDEIYDRLDAMKNEIGNFEETKEAVKKLYDDLKREEELYRSTFNSKKKAYKDSFCIIGNTASSTTDLGTTPFNRAYPNVGTHANVYNSIMTRNFVIELPWIAGFLVAALAALFVVKITENKSVWFQNILGIFVVVAAVGLPLLLMVLFRVFVPPVAPVLIAISVYLVVTILRFVTSEKDKNVLRNAFSTYLAPALVEQIVKDPSKLKLGGDEKRMTALFSDIKDFSRFSEVVTPVHLVSILNEYLGSMSDKILDEGGTIDKYIGDSIVSFFGAPFELENSAWSACVAAIRMKQLEKEFNKENLANGNIPRELNTRIGINTGEMVVGNMGTSAKMNYTIMGDAVNLASRLEGVNKVYHSWILCSDSTWQEANSGEHFGKIVARRFDKVRVVGRDEPVQLWNIIGFRDELPENVLEAADVFRSAMDKYLEKNFTESRELFEKAAALVPGDESPLVYAHRCGEFIEKGIPENWNGVITLTTK